jgi:UDP-N-acetylglucosamine acyltransferase
VIHPTAIIDSNARIGEGVEIGPYSIIGPDVEIGAGTWIGPHVVIRGPTRIGRENRIFQFASLGDIPQHKSFQGEVTRLEVGDRNTIREYVTFNRGTLVGHGVTRVGNDNFIMAYCHVAHDCIVGNHTTFANGSSLAGHVEVGDFAVLGGFTMVHQFCRVGAYSMTAVNSVVMASGYGAEPHGLNVRGLKRRGFNEDAVLGLRRAYKILYKSELILDEALKQLEPLVPACPPVGDLIAFIKGSERGIIR